MAVSTRSELFRRASQLIPGGVNSPVRAMRAVGLDEPVFFRRGEGAYLEDVEGRRYLDWVMSWGPLIFGHADEETLAAVVEAAAAGHDLRRADGGRSRARRGDRRRRPVGRAGAPRVLGHRGVDERDPARPRLHEPRPHPPLRRLLPRPRRLAAGRRGLRRRDARHPVEPRRADGRDRRHRRRAVQRRRGGGLGRRALRRGARQPCWWSRLRGTWASSRPSRGSWRRSARSATPPARCWSSTR